MIKISVNNTYFNICQSYMYFIVNYLTSIYYCDNSIKCV